MNQSAGSSCVHPDAFIILACLSEFDYNSSDTTCMHQKSLCTSNNMNARLIKHLCGPVTAALVWNSKELFSYISLPKLDFLKLAGSALEVRCKHILLLCHVTQQLDKQIKVQLSFQTQSACGMDNRSTVSKY